MSSTTLVSPAFYVAPYGNDSNAGTVEAPFATLAKAQTAMQTSSIKATYIRGGTYNLAANLDLGSADSETSWLGYLGEVPVIDGGGTVTDLFFLDAGTQNVTIDHLTFQNCVSSAIHLNGYRTSTSDGTIRGCVISNNTIQFVTGSTSGGAGGTGGIRGTFAVENNTIRNNLITDTTGPSITLVGGSAGETISGNTISFNECLRSNTSNLASIPFS